MTKTLQALMIALFFIVLTAVPHAVYAIEELELDNNSPTPVPEEPTPEPTLEPTREADTPTPVPSPTPVPTEGIVVQEVEEDTPTPVPKAKPTATAIPLAEESTSIPMATLAVMEEYGFVVPKKSGDDGTLSRGAGNSAKRTVFRLDDQVVLSLTGKKIPAKGDLFVVYRDKLEVQKGDTVLTQARFIGVGVVDTASRGGIVGHITRCMDAMQAGDKFILSGSWRPSGEPSPDMKGSLVSDSKGRKLIATGDMVFVSMGTKAGAQSRLFFHAYKQPNPGGEKEIVATIQIIATTPYSSVALVNWASEDLNPGAALERAILQ